MEKEFKRCKNPMCTKIIWRDGYKYGAGDYCDFYCKVEGVHWNKIFNKKNKQLMSLTIQ